MGLLGTGSGIPVFPNSFLKGLNAWVHGIPLLFRQSGKKHTIMIGKMKMALAFALGAFLSVSCSDEPEYTRYENPHWTVVASEEYSESCTIVMDLPANLKAYQDTLADVVGAFVGQECRGVSTQQDGLFYIMVLGSGSETGNIELRYYNARNKYMYRATELIPFVINQRIGSTDEPYVPGFDIL